MHDKAMTDIEAHLRMQRDNLFAERNILVAMLSKIYPSVIAYRMADENGDDGGHSLDGYVVYIQLPTGQVSFHVGEDSRSSWFEHLMLSQVPVWDRHNSDEKWQRITEFLDMEVA
jgi:hypothetical protein